MELYFVKVIKLVAFLTICAKLTMAFTLTLLFADVVVVSAKSRNIADRQICIPLFTPSCWDDVRFNVVVNFEVDLSGQIS